MAAEYWESLQSAKQADQCLSTMFVNTIFFLVGHFLGLPSFVDAVLSLIVSKPSNTLGKRSPSELYSQPLPVLLVARIGLQLTLESRKVLSLSFSCPSFSNPWDYRLMSLGPAWGKFSHALMFTETEHASRSSVLEYRGQVSLLPLWLAFQATPKWRDMEVKYVKA